MFSQTFGYLLGFLVGALIGSWIVGEGGLMSPRRLLLACASVLLATYALGVLHLALWFKLFRGLDILEALGLALLAGVLPFILWDAMKAYIALLLYILTLRIRRVLKL
jgi:biotin transporter BioY